MNLNRENLNALVTDLADVANALLEGNTVWLSEPGIGWVKTQLVNPARPREDYHLGDNCPPSEYNNRVA